jgi:hypothetical protein
MSSSEITDILKILNDNIKDINDDYYYLIKHNNNYYLDEIKPHPYLYLLISFIDIFINSSDKKDKFIAILNFITWFEILDNYYNIYINYNLDIIAKKNDDKENIKIFNSTMKNCDLDIIKKILINNNIKESILFFNYLKKVLKTTFNEDLYIIDTIINNLYKINNKKIDNKEIDNIDLKYQNSKYIIDSNEIATYDKGELIYNNYYINVNLYKKYINNPIIINIFRDFNNYLKKKIDHLNDDNISSKLLDIKNYKLYYKFIIISNNKDEIKDFIKINTITNDITNNNIISNNKNLIEYDNHLIFNNNDINYKYNIYGYIHNNIFSTTNSNKLFDYIIYEYNEINNINLITNIKFKQYNFTNIKLEHNNNSCNINTIIISLFNSKHKAIFDLLYFLTPIDFTNINKDIIKVNDEVYYYKLVLELKEKLLFLYSNLEDNIINETRKNIRQILSKLTNDNEYIDKDIEIHSIFNILCIIYTNFNIYFNNNNDSKLTITDNIKKLYTDNNCILIGTDILWRYHYVHKEIKLKQNKTLKINSLILYYDNSSIDLFPKTGEKNPISGGHYICLFKVNDKWYLYNDLSNNKVPDNSKYPFIWEYDKTINDIEDLLDETLYKINNIIISTKYITIMIKSPEEYEYYKQKKLEINELYRKCHIYSILYIAE